MDATIVAVVILGFLLFIAAVTAPSVYATWRRAMSEHSDLQIWQVMSRKGLQPGDAAGKERELVVAARRCAACDYTTRCDAWLAAGRRDGLEEFCGNTRFFEDLALGKRRPARR